MTKSAPLQIRDEHRPSAADVGTDLLIKVVGEGIKFTDITIVEC